MAWWWQYYGNADKVVGYVVALIILGVSLYVILSKNYKNETENWAFGTAGAAIGYLLK